MLIAVASNLFVIQDQATFRDEGKKEILLIVVCQCVTTLPTDHKVLLVPPELMAEVGQR